MRRLWGLAAAAWACLACSPGRAAGPSRESAPSASARFVYECDVDGNADLCLVPAGGGEERRLTTHPAEDMWPRFTPDGREVVFSSRRGGEWQLWSVAVDGGEARPLRGGTGREWQSDPSPDGARVAFLSNAGGEESLRVAPLGRPRAPGRVLLTQGPRVVMGNPHWAPDGSRLALSSNAGRAGHHVYVVDAATGDARRVSPLLSGACEPRFSPDGRRLAYVRRRHLDRGRSRIVDVDLENGRERVLVDWPALNYDPVYAPDGSEIAFVSTVASGGRDQHAIYRQRLSDGRAWRVTFRYPARHPDPSPR